MAIAPAPRKRAPRAKTSEFEVPEIIWLTPQQAWEGFDAYTRKHLGMSGDEYNAAWDEGELVDRIEERYVLGASFMMCNRPG